MTERYKGKESPRGNERERSFWGVWGEREVLGRTVEQKENQESYKRGKTEKKGGEVDESGLRGLKQNKQSPMNT